MDPVRYGQLVIEKASVLTAQLPSDSPTVKAIHEFQRQDASMAGGCKGCKKRRMLRWLAQEVQRSSDRSVVDTVVPVQ